MTTTIKAISLHQPWASLIPMGLKKYETRSWSTSYRGPLLICAAKKISREQKLYHQYFLNKYQQLLTDTDNYVDIIESDRPAIALIENPTGLLARGMATILKDLSQIGYLCEWETLPAYCLGLPHERERVFIIAYPDGLFYRQQPTPWADQVRNHIEEVRLSHEIRSFEPGVLAVAHGVSIGVAKNIPGNYNARRAYGLSCSPRQAAVAWKRIDYLCSLLPNQECAS